MRMSRWIPFAALALCACGGPQNGSGSTEPCRLTMGRPEVQGAVARRDVERAFERREQRIERCLAHEPEAVELDIRVVVPRDGHPSRVLITEGLITDRRTGECLDRELRRLRLPST